MTLPRTFGFLVAMHQKHVPIIRHPEGAALAMKQHLKELMEFLFTADVA